MLPSHCWFSEFPDALTTCLSGIPVLYFHVGHRLTSLLLSCHQPFQLGGHVFGKGRMIFLAPLSVWDPTSFLCLHPTASPHPLLQPSSSVELVFISLETLPWMVCHRLPLKSFLLLSNKDGAKSHPELTPHRVFPQYFTENTKQKCHSTRGVFFLRM